MGHTANNKTGYLVCCMRSRLCVDTFPTPTSPPLAFVRKMSNRRLRSSGNIMIKANVRYFFRIEPTAPKFTANTQTRKQISFLLPYFPFGLIHVGRSSNFLYLRSYETRRIVVSNNYVDDPLARARANPISIISRGS